LGTNLSEGGRQGAGRMLGVFGQKAAEGMSSGGLAGDVAAFSREARLAEQDVGRLGSKIQLASDELGPFADYLSKSNALFAKFLQEASSRTGSNPDAITRDAAEALRTPLSTFSGPSEQIKAPMSNSADED
jgi:hypothetical protein